MRNLFLILILISGIRYTGFSETISRVEPPFWWAGMKSQDLQIMVYGKDIGTAEVKMNSYPGVTIKRIVKAENPNYLFIYLEINKAAKPGEIRFTFKTESGKTEIGYNLLPRSGSSGAQGFSSKDLLYLIMPDRFANGDPKNDNWGKDTIDRFVQDARHGGDFAGIENHLDYIADLGVTALWLNPVLENKMPEEKYRSYHGYATTDYYKVDKRLGSNEDYCRLISASHKKGIKMVMDMIFNHCGSYHWWMNDLPFKDWLNHQEGYVQTTHNSFVIADIHAPASEKSAMTDGWFSEAMPDLNQRNPLLADYLIQNSIWWIEYARIDGIRHDTHPYVDFNFLSKWCKRVMEEYPDFNIVGESWFTLPWWQADSRVNPSSTYLKTVMDFNLYKSMEQTFPYINNADFHLRNLYEIITQDYLYSNPDNILVFLDNHDVSRFNKKEETDLARYKQAITFLLTTRGIPQLYYGTEILLTGEKSEGDGALRKDFPGGWKEDCINAFLPDNRSDLQNEAYTFLRKIAGWRRTSKAVTEGRLIHYAPDETRDNFCYVYARITDDQKVLVILNGSSKPQTISFERYYDVIGDSVSGKDVITDCIIPLKGDLKIQPKGIYILEIEKK
ncbi:MAG: glycoside hydrolase family 13 protein [Bacteroidales bacterium]|nr:glycoside hydrolase family 13 protein [Bacteroidales bacterium]